MAGLWVRLSLRIRLGMGGTALASMATRKPSACCLGGPVGWQSVPQPADARAVLVVMRRANTTEISSAMHELGALQQHTGSLRQQLLANNGELQAAGAAFAARLEEVQEVTALQQGVADARKVGGCIVVLLESWVYDAGSTGNLPLQKSVWRHLHQK